MGKFIITEEEKKHILTLYNLVEDFKTQKIKFINQGYDEQIVNKYLNNFREIKDKKYKVAANAEIDNLNVPKGNDRFNIDNYKTFEELESLVDYMSGQVNIGESNFTDIKVDGKPIFENDTVEIYFAPNKQSCVEYKGDKPYSWCISRTDTSNMYARYRMGETEPSFYFVKRKKPMEEEFSHWDKNEFKGTFVDKWHFFVLQILKDNSYIISSANNDGDKRTNWDGVIKVAPELNGLKEYFKNVPLTDEEKLNYVKFKGGLTDEEFSKLTYPNKTYYIDVATDVSKRLSDNKFLNLPEDLKNKYINLGIGLTDNQFNSIKDNPKLSRRYSEITDRAIKDYISDDFFISPRITKSQYEFVSDEDKKKLDDRLNRDVSRSLDSIGATFRMIEKYINVKGKFERDDSFDLLLNTIPNMFLIEKFSTKEFFLQNMEKVFKFSVILLLFSPKSEFIKFLEFLGLTFDEFKNTLTKEESDLIYKMISQKKE
jgi:hypothetical protein